MTTNRLFKLLLPLSVLFAACSSDDNKPVLPEFPVIEAVSVDAGQETEIKFDAQGEWRLVSDKTWLSFVTGNPAEEVPVIFGGAGQQSITVIAKTEGLSFGPETAILKMTMGGHTQNVGEVTRNGKLREAEMKVRAGYSGPFTAVERLDMVSGTSYRIGFMTNFDWKLESQPDWLVPFNNITGKAGVDVILSNAELVSVESEFSAYEKNGEIVIVPRYGNGSPVTFPVTYGGLDDKIINLSTPAYKNNGVTFSNDGFYCAPPSNEPTTNKSITFTVTTKNMERRIVLMEYDKGTNSPKEVSLDGSWVSCVESPDTKGEMTISVLGNNETTAARSLYLYFLPPYYFENTYNYAKDFTNLGGNITFNGRNALGMAITQLGKAKTEGFTIYDDVEREMLPAPVKVADPYIDDWYGIPFVYTRTFTQEEWDAMGIIWIENHGNPDLEEVFWDLEDTFVRGDIGCQDGKAAIWNRVPFATLPDGPAYLFFMQDPWTIHSVLRIEKASE